MLKSLQKRRRAYLQLFSNGRRVKKRVFAPVVQPLLCRVPPLSLSALSSAVICLNQYMGEVVGHSALKTGRLSVIY